MLQVILVWFEMGFTYPLLASVLCITHCFLPSSVLLDAALLTEVSQC